MIVSLPVTIVELQPSELTFAHSETSAGQLLDTFFYTIELCLSKLVSLPPFFFNITLHHRHHKYLVLRSTFCLDHHTLFRLQRRKMAEVDAMDVQLDGIGKSQDQEIEMEFADEGFVSDVDLIEPTTTTTKTPNPTKDAEQSSSPLFVSQDNISEHPLLARGEALRPEAVKKRDLAVVVPPIQRPWEYLVYEEPEIKEIMEAYDNGEYLVQFEDEREEVVSSPYIPLAPGLVTTSSALNIFTFSAVDVYCLPSYLTSQLLCHSSSFLRKLPTSRLETRDLLYTSHFYEYHKASFVFIISYWPDHWSPYAILFLSNSFFSHLCHLTFSSLPILVH